ncbi:MAG: DinB family protein [Thermoanaerobaculaceae bacterium]|jgi:uncharacterized damage-inducible protein DinB
MSEISPALARDADRLFGEYLDKIERSAGLLSADQLWWRPNPQCNSIGNLLLHLCGNLSQWVLAGLAGQAFERHRREEFAAVEGHDGAELLGRLRDVVTACRGVVGNLTEDDLGRTFTIQSHTRTGFGVLLHAIEHTSYHTGQIVAIAKQLLGDRTEIEFYPHLK